MRRAFQAQDGSSLCTNEASFGSRKTIYSAIIWSKRLAGRKLPSVKSTPAANNNLFARTVDAPAASRSRRPADTCPTAHNNRAVD